MISFHLLPMADQQALMGLLPLRPAIAQRLKDHAYFLSNLRRLEEKCDGAEINWDPAVIGAVFHTIPSHISTRNVKVPEWVHYPHLF